MTWGDAFFADVQYLIIVLSCWVYGPFNARLQRLRTAYAGLFILLFLLTITRTMPKWLVLLLGMLPTPMVIAGRVPQILLSYREKHTGQLSVESLAMQTAGCSARIVSTLIMVPDRLVLISHVTAAVFAAIPLAQVIYYWDNTKKHLAKGETKKVDPVRASRESNTATTRVQHRKRLEED
eukprot:Protomagalhaensia_sp_Gyna_25__3097@NODE_2840_length_864_cov_8_367273_g2369_i0_p1_GENE_NODE_2840_length_864_cov_8_367273_g2369_i0NODE_2840_length_864_cov_8_367273_g2369_i0_p1_ORF_typecomplete_len180_score11_60PQloop/PF04193_14/3_6e03PQloop/PF04193_14/2_3e09MtN3_slv/PF03083_16/9_8e03MtN3_slv/PF03083_16/1_3e04MtN3_slv/PF03083_16/0_035Wzy_C/PF04932_15/1_6_NODE_2840_length_864_cov_8_367273_g2369_i0201740